MCTNEANPSLERIFYVFKLFGIWQKSEDDLKYRYVWKIAHKINYVLYQILLLTFAFTAEDKNEKTFVGLMYLIITVVSVKMLYLLAKKKEILSFLSDSYVDVSNLNSKIQIEVSKKERIFIQFANAYLLLIVICLILFVGSTFPLFTADRKLPFHITFSLDWKHEATVHWILYISMSWTTVLSLVYNSLTVIVWCILYNFSIQYDVLGKQFKALGTSGNCCFLRDLITLIKVHRNLYK